MSLARMTMAIAFQRTSERIRRSMNRSPGMGRSSWGDMVFRKGVVIALGSGTRAASACSDRWRSNSLVASGPLARNTASSDSVHSSISIESKVLTYPPTAPLKLVTSNADWLDGSGCLGDSTLYLANRANCPAD